MSQGSSRYRRIGMVCTIAVIFTATVSAGCAGSTTKTFEHYRERGDRLDDNPEAQMQLGVAKFGRALQMLP